MASTGVRWVDVLRLRVRSLFQRQTVENELDDEVIFHLESLVEMYVAGGMAEAEARRRARIEAGCPEQIKDDVRDTFGWSLLDNLVKDPRFAGRGFRRSPAFTLTAIGAIALGVGVNTALFSVLYSMVLRPIPVRHP